MQESMQLRDVTAVTVPRVGRVEETGDPSLPYRLLDRDGIEVAAVSEFLLDMLADDDSPASLRSYAYELLAWFRFLWALDVQWDRAGRTAIGGAWTNGTASNAKPVSAGRGSVDASLRRASQNSAVVRGVLRKPTWANAPCAGQQERPALTTGRICETRKRNRRYR